MPGERDRSAIPEEARVGWFSFLSMAGAEMRWPVIAALLAALALIPLAALRDTGSLPLWAVMSPALAFLAATFWGWVASYRRLQALDDYPRSNIGSAPQGYVRLEGLAAFFPGKPLECPLTHRRCCWYSYQVIEQDDQRRNRSSEEHETSEWSFMMNDGSGECVVDPVGAKLVPVRLRKWREGNFHYTERLILPGDPLFVLGEFSTAGSMVTESDIEFQMGQQIAEWKKDMPALVERFGLDGSGRISEQEWGRVRTQARRDVEAELARNPPQPQNSVAKPADGRPFVISAESRRRLERDTAIWVWIHLSCFLLGAALLAAWAFRR
jgi:hypothetical protein